FRKDIAAIRDKVKKGDIGRVLEVRAAWMRKNGVPKPGSWFTQSRFSGGGVLMDLGPHLLPICLDLVGDHPLRISTAVLRCDSKTREKRGAQWYSSDQKAGGQMNVEMDVEDTLSALMVFENNSSIHLDLSWDAPVPGDVTSFKVVGSKGTLELDTLFGMSPQRLHEKDRLAVYNHNTGKTSVEQKKPEHNLTMEAFFNMIRHFIAVIEKKAEPEISGKDAIRTVTVTGGIYKNYKL
ncbi:MAG: Gfo/Idh/MocA family oxidoreductase, partial [bacterium]|nr:Gfo/Idh/MocA family oxidoreductase [bacterium]